MITSEKRTRATGILPGAIITATVVAVSTIGGGITSSGMGWYRTLELPAITPPGSTIGMVWAAIYTLGGIAAYLIWQGKDMSPVFKWLIALLIANAGLNVFWTWLFFGIHWTGLAVVEMIILNLTNLAIILLNWNRSRLASLLLIPYLVWVCFATYLAYAIWQLNR